MLFRRVAPSFVFLLACSSSSTSSPTPQLDAAQDSTNSEAATDSGPQCDFWAQTGCPADQACRSTGVCESLAADHGGDGHYCCDRKNCIGGYTCTDGTPYDAGPDSGLCPVGRQILTCVQICSSSGDPRGACKTGTCVDDSNFGTGLGGCR